MFKYQITFKPKYTTEFVLDMIDNVISDNEFVTVEHDISVVTINDTDCISVTVQPYFEEELDINNWKQFVTYLTEEINKAY